MEAALDERLLEQLYTWIDSIPLTRPKKDLKRDFSDGALVGEVVKHYYPNLVDLHNYPAAQALHNKTTNWNILNRKVFRRLGFEVTDELIQKMVKCKPWCAEQFLLLLRQRLSAQSDKVNAADTDSAGEGDGFVVLGPSHSGVKMTGVQGKQSGGDLAGRGTDKQRDLMLAAFIDSISDLNVKTCIEDKLRDLDSKNKTIHELQVKLRRMERLLQQRELRITELQTRCRHLEKQNRAGKISTAVKRPSQTPTQQQQQPPEQQKQEQEQLQQLGELEQKQLEQHEEPQLEQDDLGQKEQAEEQLEQEQLEQEKLKLEQLEQEQLEELQQELKDLKQEQEEQREQEMEKLEE